MSGNKQDNGCGITQGIKLRLVPVLGQIYSDALSPHSCPSWLQTDCYCSSTPSLRRVMKSHPRPSARLSVGAETSRTPIPTEPHCRYQTNKARTLSQPEYEHHTLTLQHHSTT